MILYKIATNNHNNNFLAQRAERKQRHWCITELEKGGKVRGKEKTA